MLALTVPGMRLVHEGQIEGRRLKIPVQLGRRRAEPSDPMMQAHYERLLRAVSDPVFHEGAWQLLDAAGGTERLPRVHRAPLEPG